MNMTREQAIGFLREAARYFENRASVNDEDATFWANVHNAEHCREIAEMLVDGQCAPPSGDVDR